MFILLSSVFSLFWGRQTVNIGFVRPDYSCAVSSVVAGSCLLVIQASLMSLLRNLKAPINMDIIAIIMQP